MSLFPGKAHLTQPLRVSLISSCHTTRDYIPLPFQGLAQASGAPDVAAISSLFSHTEHHPQSPSVSQLRQWVEDAPPCPSLAQLWNLLQALLPVLPQLQNDLLPVPLVVVVVVLNQENNFCLCKSLIITVLLLSSVASGRESPAGLERSQANGFLHQGSEHPHAPIEKHSLP